MTVSVEEIDRWDAGDVREVFHAVRSRAEAASEASDGVAGLPDNQLVMAPPAPVIPQLPLGNTGG